MRFCDIQATAEQPFDAAAGHTADGSLPAGFERTTEERVGNAI